MTEPEQAQWRLDWLASQAVQLGLSDPPDVALIRWSSGNGAASEAMASCLTEAGYDTIPVYTGGVAWQAGNVPESQQVAYNLAVYTCYAQYTLDPRLFQEWTPEQAGLLYDYWVEYFAPCMAAHGYPVPDSQRPSRATWVATYKTPDRPQWYPPERLEAITDMELQNQIGARCPAMPPDSTFYGA